MTPITVIAGFLGAGKTTTIRAWMAAREQNAAVIVNDFGEAGIDAALLGDGTSVTNIPGGCICCTAPAGLARAVATVLDEVRPTRIFIEPSGLARPRDVLDMLARGGLRDRVALGPTVVIVDPNVPPNELSDEQLDAADVLVINRTDLASPDAVAALRESVAARWPGPARVLETSHGVLPEDALSWPEGAGATVRYARVHDRPSTDGYRARSWILPPDRTVSWDRLRALLTSTPGIARFKGLFYGDVGWFRVDVAGGQLHFDATSWRRDNRADLILSEGDPAAFELEACFLPTEAASEEHTLALVDLDGFELRLDRRALAGLPGQVPDVGALVPGRAGVGVPLHELLALIPAPADARFVVAARDGMNAAPSRIADIGAAVLVHSLDGGELPEKQGGPFRILVPVGSGSCANVKGVARIRVVPAG